MSLIGKVVVEKDEMKRIEYSTELQNTNDRIKEVEISLKTEGLEKALENIKSFITN